MPATTEQNTVVIEGVSWETYLQMDELLDDAPVRMKWADDRLEIMSPISRHHELIKSNIGCMIETFCRRRGLFFQITGSATMRKDRLRGGEPDDSYIFSRGQEATDLVIEAALSSRALISSISFARSPYPKSGSGKTTSSGLCLLRRQLPAHHRKPFPPRSRFETRRAPGRASLHLRRAGRIRAPDRQERIP